MRLAYPDPLPLGTYPAFRAQWGAVSITCHYLEVSFLQVDVKRHFAKWEKKICTTFFLCVFCIVFYKYACNRFIEWTELSGVEIGLSFLFNHSLHTFCIECPFYTTSPMTSQADLKVTFGWKNSVTLVIKTNLVCIKMILFCLNRNTKYFQFKISFTSLALPAQASSVTWNL